MEVAQPSGEEVLLRQALHRFCAAALLYPEPERIATLKEGGAWLAQNMDGPWPGPELRQRLEAVIDWLGGLNGDLSAAQGEWVRLFGVSRTAFCFPYEGANVKPQHAGALQAGLQQEYAEAGLVVSPDDLPDHVGVELEFMSFLCGMECEAIRLDRDDVRQRIVERQHRFLTEHLCKWLPGLTERVQQADGKIFTEICAAAEQISADEKQRLDAVQRGPSAEQG